MRDKGLDEDRARPDETVAKLMPASTSTSAETRDEEDKKEALIAGLAFCTHPSTLLSYMIPMDLVVEDIESVTGWKVAEPKYCGFVKQNLPQEKENPPT